MFTLLLLDEPVPVNGRMKVPVTQRLGVCPNPECKLERPYGPSAIAHDCYTPYGVTRGQNRCCCHELSRAHS